MNHTKQNRVGGVYLVENSSLGHTHCHHFSRKRGCNRGTQLAEYRHFNDLARPVNTMEGTEEKAVKF